MAILLVILCIIIIVMIYVIRNLLIKNERQEDILTGYMVYLNKISKIIDESDKKLQEIDHRGSFKADDEIGFFFESVKNIQTILNSFNVKNL